MTDTTQPFAAVDTVIGGYAVVIDGWHGTARIRLQEIFSDEKAALFHCNEINAAAWRWREELMPLCVECDDSGHGDAPGSYCFCEAGADREEHDRDCAAEDRAESAREDRQARWEADERWDR